MDFVIAGIVIGGLLVACGVFLRDLGPRLLAGPLRRKSSVNPDPRTDPAWKRYCVAIGSLITAGGLLMVLAAVLGIVFDVSDGTGSRMVMLAGVVALGCMLLAALVVTPHYRRGGFERRAIDESVEVAKPITAPFRSAPADDLFAPERVVKPQQSHIAAQPKSPTVASAAAVITRVTDVINPEPNAIASNGPLPDTGDQTWERVEPEPPVTEINEPGLAESALSPAKPEPIEYPVEPKSAPFAASQQLYERASSQRSEPTPVPDPSAYLVDLDDDELPAWNAPVPDPARSDPGTTGGYERAGLSLSSGHPGGFQSSLLADLTESPDEPEDLTGTFKSRLLNELTRVPAAPAEPTVDVLLDEFSVPPEESPENRGSGSTR